MQKVIQIQGMNCGHCTASVEKALKAVDGVSGVTVDLAAKKATLEAETGVSNDALKKAVTDAGFEVTGIDG